MADVGCGHGASMILMAHAFPASTFAASLSQDVGLALGAQAGEARIRNVVTSAGFSRFRRVSETPFNIVFEARP